MINYLKVLEEIGFFIGYNEGLSRYHNLKSNFNRSDYYKRLSVISQNTAVNVKKRAIKNVSHKKVQLTEAILQGKLRGLKASSDGVSNA